MYKIQGEKLKQLRNSFGYTLSFVSKRLNITTNYLSLIERGERKPSEVIMYNMAKFYNLNPIEIFSLYGIVPTKELEKVISCPNLVEILSNIDSDSGFTEEEKESLSNILKEEILKLLDKRKE